MPFNPDKPGPFRQPLQDPKDLDKIKEGFEEIVRKHSETGLDRSKESFVDIEEEIRQKPYEKFRKAVRERRKRNNNKTKKQGLASEIKSASAKWKIKGGGHEGIERSLPTGDR